MTDFAAYLNRAMSGAPLTADDIGGAFSALLEGSVDPIQAGAFLVALKVRGETPNEIAAAAKAMRSAALTFEGPVGCVDTCGTGGDGANTYNISTGTAIVLAACGVPVAKHGNRGVSSKSGSSDVLTALGVNVAIDPQRAEACLNEIGLGFLFAPNHHPAMKHVAPVRQSLGVRTLFNLLGPLTNPAGARRQLLGVYDEALIRPIAETLGALGSESAWVVHGSDGLDELTVTGPSTVGMLKDGNVTVTNIVPADVGISRRSPEDLVGGTPEDNAAALLSVLEGDDSAYRDAIVLNTAAGLVIGGAEDDLRVAARRAADAIDSRAAGKKLDALIEFTNP